MQTGPQRESRNRAGESAESSVGLKTDLPNLRFLFLFRLFSHEAEIDVAINQSEQVIRRNLVFQAEAIFRIHAILLCGKVPCSRKNRLETSGHHAVDLTSQEGDIITIVPFPCDTNSKT